MILTADWHLKPESEKTVLEVLAALVKACHDLEDYTICVLGDVYHVRHQVPVALQNNLVDFLHNSDVNWVFISGNHDQVDVAGRNALEVLGHLPNVEVYSAPEWASVDGVTIAMFPFRKELSEYDEILNSTPQYSGDAPIFAFLHHGIQGAKMNNHVVAGEGDGIPASNFAAFQTVFLGHWHRHQVVGNCVYVGSPWQTKADEAGEAKGYIHLDDKTMKWTFHELRIGRRFWKDGMDLSEVSEGDRVSTADETLANDLREKGVEVIMEKVEEKYQARFALPPGATAREYAVKFVEERGGELDPALLLEIFDEVTA